MRMTTKFFTSHCYKGADFFYSSKNDNRADLDTKFSTKFIHKTQPFPDATDLGNQSHLKMAEF